MDAETVTTAWHAAGDGAAGTGDTGPREWARALAIGLFVVAVIVALVVLMAMAGGASATGGCGGG